MDNMVIPFFIQPFIVPGVLFSPSVPLSVIIISEANMGVMVSGRPPVCRTHTHITPFHICFFVCFGSKGQGKGYRNLEFPYVTCLSEYTCNGGLDIQYFGSIYKVDLAGFFPLRHQNKSPLFILFLVLVSLIDK